MKLHRLRITGIGPFAGSAEVDFARLSESGLFLLEGPTGAGKSTIIDAISFALYGKIAQASADGERLRSHFAGPEVDSVVDLVFQTQSGCYRVRRTPKFLRPKRRGDGLTPVNAKASLWRLSAPDAESSGELLSTRLDEVADEITRAVGLTHPQFVQTVILPQGEFASFLRACSDDKKALLQKLFGTEQLARVQLRLVEDRQRALQLRATATAAIHSASHAFAGAAGISTTEVDELEVGDNAALIAFAQDTVAQLRDAAAVAADAADLARLRRVGSLEDLNRERDLIARRATRSDLRRRLAALRAGLPAENALREEISIAERAAPVMTVAAAWRAAEERREQSFEQARQSRLRLPAQWRDADELSIRVQADAVQSRRGALAEDLHRETELSGLKLAHRKLNAANDDAVTSTERTLAALTAADGALTQARQLRERAAIQAGELATVRVAHAHAEAVRAAAAEAEIAERKVQQHESLATTALAAARTGADLVHELRQRRIAGIAGELGLTLADDEPCAVCGSLVHPSPARPGTDHVSQSQLHEAESLLAQLSEALAEARDELAAARQSHTDCLARSGGVPLTQASQEAVQLRQRCAVAEQAVAEVADLDQQIAALADEVSALHAAHGEITTQHALLVDQLDRSTADITEAERRLAQARDGFASVAERLVDLDRQRSVLTDAATSIAADTAASDAAQHARAVFDKALAEAGFEEASAAAVAHRPPLVLASLRAALDALRVEWSTVEEGLAAPSLNDAALDHAPADLAALTANVAEDEQRAGEAERLAGSATATLALASAGASRISQAVADSAALFTSTAAALRLGQLVAGLGDNQLRMDLATYVLVRRFEEIVSAANEQLRRISSGRYQLEHSDAKHGNARSGLGLLIHDLRTDRTRDPATLSGGETFYVSMSLALGLADVVRAESGGIELGTLFIDEGFGSLDSEVLDEVMTILDSLREGGRTVGVVSHVTELKARVADRISVRRNPDGSSRLSVLA